MSPGNAKRWLSAAIAFFLTAGFSWRVDAETRVNLLKLPSVTLEATSLVGDRVASASALMDGNRETVASIDPGEAETIDLVFGFAGETVALESAVIVLSRARNAVPAARVEVLASILSPQSGFKSLRSDPISRSAPTQSFAFPPTAARWIMIRLTPAKKGTPIALSEVEVLGHPGEPKTNYAFAEAPARVIDILSRLESASTVSLAVSADEKRTFEKAKAGRLDPAAFAEAALLASGVLDTEKRKAYLGRIETIATKARAAVASARNSKERGNQLLRWLHREALKGGYRRTQTDLSVLLDNQTFNCVSSAVLYNIVALKLGLDARAIEVPDHAFSIVYEGVAHMDVETTTPQGFDPARDQIAKFERLTGFRYIADTHRDRRREVTEAGLVALIYYNKGVELDKAKRYHDALLAYFRAMSLDLEFASAAKNALATMANWGIELAEQRKWQQAVDVVTVGVTLAPKDAALTNNQLAIWNWWARSLIDSGQRDEAFALLKRAAIALPNGNFEAMQAWAYLKFAEDLVKARNWQAAYSITDDGLSVLAPKARAELIKWRNDLHLRWANADIRDGRFDGAATALSQGLKAAPDNSRLREMVGYLGQEWAKKEASDGFSKGLAVLAALDRQFSGAPALGEAVKYYVSKQVSAMIDKGRFNEALAGIEEAGGLLRDKEMLQELGVFAIDTGAKARMKAQAWDEAGALYVRGLKQYPENALLKNNAAYLAQEWAQAALAKGGVEASVPAFRDITEKFSSLSDVRQSLLSVVSGEVNRRVDAGKHEGAVALAERLQNFLPENEAVMLVEFSYDSWARRFFENKKWKEAIKIYDQGLKRLPESSLLKQNRAYCASQDG